MDEHGRITIAKSPSTPKDFAEGFFNALEVAAEKISLTLRQLMKNTRLLLHGTTVDANAIRLTPHAPVVSPMGRLRVVNVKKKLVRLWKTTNFTAP
jgi:N-methylhydantoinase A/oxoprolinase/acetone carboxylase beta subunit